MTRKLTCIECPIGCPLVVEIEDSRAANISGAECPKGEEYAVSEIENPVRTITGTVVAEGLLIKLVPVKTDGAIPKDRVMDVMFEIRKIKIKKPFSIGETVIKNLLGLKVNLIATRSVQ